MAKKDIKDHLQNVCTEGSFLCQNCGKEDIGSKIKKHDCHFALKEEIKRLRKELAVSKSEYTQVCGNFTRVGKLFREKYDTADDMLQKLKTLEYENSWQKELISTFEK